MDTNQNQPPATPKQQVVERLKQASNVLVSVKSNPSVDELASAIGLTLMLNKLDKHATAVFSGEVPSTLEFLKPEETLEANTDSLRDFIVSLDKSKADKLRYKVEEDVVRIYITPYRTSISEADLEFTQGDFNVDVVVALGVTQREELDQAITMHGRILHDATVITVTAGQGLSELGQINWEDSSASSLSEMLVSISEAFQGGLIDEQIATAFLTGIVSETERFSNTKTSPKVMTMSAQLMAAGANQQLIANELEKVVEVDMHSSVEAVEQVPAEGEAPVAVASGDGTLSINHAKSSQDEASVDSSEVGLGQADESGEQVSNESENNASDSLPKITPLRKRSSPLLSPVSAPESLDSFNPLMDSGSQSASELEVPDEEPVPTPPVESITKPEVPIEHDMPTLPPPPPPPVIEEKEDEQESEEQIQIDHEGNLIRNAATSPKHKVIQPPESEPEPETPASEPDTSNDVRSVLPPPPEMDMTPSPPIPDTTTIEQLEQSVNSHHINDQSSEGGQADSGFDSASDTIGSAFSSQSSVPPPPQADLINAAPLEPPPPSTPSSFDAYRLPDLPMEDINSTESPYDAHLRGGSDQGPPAPPPVPPPMFPQS